MEMQGTNSVNSKGVEHIQNWKKGYKMTKAIGLILSASLITTIDQLIFNWYD